MNGYIYKRESEAQQPHTTNAESFDPESTSAFQFMVDDGVNYSQVPFHACQNMKEDLSIESNTNCTGA